MWKEKPVNLRFETVDVKDARFRKLFWGRPSKAEQSVVVNYYPPSDIQERWTFRVTRLQSGFSFGTLKKLSILIPFPLWLPVLFPIVFISSIDTNSLEGMTVMVAMGLLSLQSSILLLNHIIDYRLGRNRNFNGRPLSLLYDGQIMPCTLFFFFLFFILVASGFLIYPIYFYWSEVSWILFLAAGGLAILADPRLRKYLPGLKEFMIFFLTGPLFFMGLGFFSDIKGLNTVSSSQNIVYLALFNGVWVVLYFLFQDFSSALGDSKRGISTLFTELSFELGKRLICFFVIIGGIFANFFFFSKVGEVNFNLTSSAFFLLSLFILGVMLRRVTSVTAPMASSQIGFLTPWVSFYVLVYTLSWKEYLWRL